jgi:hypothetical protein
VVHFVYSVANCTPSSAFDQHHGVRYLMLSTSDDESDAWIVLYIAECLECWHFDLRQALDERTGSDAADTPSGVKQAGQKHWQILEMLIQNGVWAQTRAIVRRLACKVSLWSRARGRGWQDESPSFRNFPSIKDSLNMVNCS